jgi:hypothetical protein
MLFASLTKVANDTNALHKLPVGAVTDAWIASDGSAECAMVITSHAVQHLIALGLLGCVSLTQHDNRSPAGELLSAAPLEMTVCIRPARPGAKILHHTMSSDDVALYKALSVESSHPKLTMSAAPVLLPPAAAAEPAADAGAPPLTDAEISAALQQMPEDARKRVATLFSGKLNQFNLLMAAKSKDETLIKKLQQELSAKSATKDRDLVFLKRSLATLAAQMPPDVRAMYALDDDSLGDTMNDYASGDKDRMADASLRTVLCASRALQMQYVAPPQQQQQQRQPAAQPPQRRRYDDDALRMPPPKQPASYDNGGPACDGMVPEAAMDVKDALMDTLNFSFP